MEWSEVPSHEELPRGIVHGLRLEARHGAGRIPWDAARAAFKQRLGAEPRERRRWGRIEMTWDTGKVPVTVLAGRRRILVRAHQRVSPTRLRRLMEALAGVPRLERVRLNGELDHFGRMDVMPVE